MTLTAALPGLLDGLDLVRADFPILQRTLADGHPLVYLDSANTSQKPQVVIDAMVDHLERHNANVARAMHQLGAESTAGFEGGRDKVAAFLNAPSRDEVIFTKNASEALNLVANTLAWKGELQVGPDERGDPRAGRLVGVGGLLGQLVRAAVHRGVVLLQEGPLGVEDLPRPLRGRPRVQVDQGAAAADGPRQDREVGADRRDVQRRSRRQGRHQLAAAGSAAPVYFTYPSASSSSASSAPPDFTILPPAKTCTTSGVMWRRIRV